MLELKSGDPRQEDTFIGPLISLKEAERVETWVSDAVSKGTLTCHGLGGSFECACECPGLRRLCHGIKMPPNVREF